MAAGGQSGASRADAEVKRLVARELHDRVAQTLTGMLIDVENFKTEQVGWDDVLHQLDTIQDSTRQVLQNLRQLLHELRGDETGGFKFVESLAALAARFETKTGIAANVKVPTDWPQTVLAPAALNLYRIIEEALANIQRHSGAKNVAVVLEVLPNGMLGASIIDDGRGYDPELRRAGMGTRGMQERAVLLGGDLRIDGGSETGTTVRVTFPRDRVTDSTSESSGPEAGPRMKSEEIPA